MTIASGDVLRTSVNFTLADGTLYQNVYHHRRVGLGIITDATHVAAIKVWAETMYAILDDLIASDVVAALSTVDLVVFDVDAWVVLESIGVFTPDFTATQTPALGQVNQISPFITFKTSRPQSVGRKFLFALTEGSYDAGRLTGGTVTAIVNVADDILGNIVVSAPLDYLVPGITRTSVDAFLSFTLGVVTNIPGTQRRRRFGVGA